MLRSLCPVCYARMHKIGECCTGCRQKYEKMIEDGTLRVTKEEFKGIQSGQWDDPCVLI